MTPPLPLALREAQRCLQERFAPVLCIDAALHRSLVSFQSSKRASESRWFPYREGFSAALVDGLLTRAGVGAGRLLDPFAGSGTALFAASDRGMAATGVELLPSAAEVAAIRLLLRGERGPDLARWLTAWAAARPWAAPGEEQPFPHLAITTAAFPAATERAIGRYRAILAGVADPEQRRLARFCLLAVLEAVSYTRKDGQYLRWDARSGRQRPGSRPFDKGPILAFDAALTAKAAQIAADALGDGTLGDGAPGAPLGDRGPVELVLGSSLEQLPRLPAAHFDALVTSPPYCNRYDYTRTYALELALLGADEAGLRALRQALLSCTVENRPKDLATLADPTGVEAAQRSCARQVLLGETVAYLESCRAAGTLNNAGLPRMVRQYFLELAVVLHEAARLVRPGAPFVMVNDNVRYQGVQVPVDLLLADLATDAGFDVEAIWVLPRGKGNSSQQMGAYGREEVRKGVYLWRRSQRTPSAASAAVA